MNSVEIEYLLTLTSDAEPGTGLGGEVVNDIVPRDVHDQMNGQASRPVLRSSHLKGLLRDTFEFIAEARGWPTSVTNAVFGEPGWNLPAEVSERNTNSKAIRPSRPSGNGQEAAFCLTDARAISEPEDKIYISRTALENGIARETSLRTTEAIATGTQFAGKIILHGRCSELAEAVLKTSLLSLQAIGGGRTRGCGRCVVTLTKGARSFVELLDDVERHAADLNAASSVDTVAVDIKGGLCWYDVLFRAEMPVCCPERPETGNSITSGFSIPASAVQGAILHRLNALNPNLAKACLESPNFRAWPLQPCGYPEKIFTRSVRVSLTHRVAKLDDQTNPPPINDRIQDQALEPGEVLRDLPDGSPLKAADGVLLCNSDGVVHLWRASEMPHVVSAHAVPASENLYTVDAMAPLVWRGWLAIPEECAEKIEISLRENPRVRFGKKRSVVGTGKLELTHLPKSPFGALSGDGPVLLIAQSPVLLGDDAPVGPCDEELKRLAASWAKRFNLPAPEVVWSSVGLRFGWNCNGIGKMTGRGGGRVRASRVALPGSVLKWNREQFANLKDAEKEALSANFSAAILAGLGETPDAGRMQGFGALAVHPGKAVEFFRRAPTPRSQKTFKFADAVRLADSSIAMTFGHGIDGPSPSQIWSALQIVELGNKAKSIEYLLSQIERASPRIKAKWEPLLTQKENSDLCKFIQNHSTEEAVYAFRTWADWTISRQKTEDAGHD